MHCLSIIYEKLIFQATLRIGWMYAVRNIISRMKRDGALTHSSIIQSIRRGDMKRTDGVKLLVICPMTNESISSAVTLCLPLL